VSSMMPLTVPSGASPFGALFSSYQLDSAYDEMFEPSGQAREHCRPSYEGVIARSLGELRQLQADADRAFLAQGITFTV
jgi:uncharacterized circularly permuted ATP-grasp superfamily protein